MASQPVYAACVISMLFLCEPGAPISGHALAQNEKRPSSKAAASRQDTSSKQPSPEEQLQQAFHNSGNDRVALVRNLEAFLKENPDSRQRPQVYRALVLTMRGRLELKLKDTATAQKDFEASYEILPSSAAAEKLGEIAEMKKDLKGAIEQYARAFALADATNETAGRREIRQKLGNVWRLTHGSDAGLGEYLLRTYDEVSQASLSGKPRKNADAREPSDFMLRKAPEGTAFPLKDARRKILVLNFWATWCRPCHALEPFFARVAADFQANADVLFLAANCDEDETLVKSYLEEDKPRTAVVFADGLDRFFSVNSFPTVMVIDRAGKIAYRSDGFEPDTFEANLAAAVRRALAPQSASSPAGNSEP